MKTRALGFLLMVAAAGVYAVGCGSSNNNERHRRRGRRWHRRRGGAAGAGHGRRGHGRRGHGRRTDAGTGGKVDTGTDTAKADTGTDTPVGDAPADTQAAPTFTQVFAILSNITTPTATRRRAARTATTASSPTAASGPVAAQHEPRRQGGGVRCAVRRRFAPLPGRCGRRCQPRPQARAGEQRRAERALAEAQSGRESVACWRATACAMPLNRADSSSTAAPCRRQCVDAGFTMTHYAITADQLTTIMGWINAGALNN